MRLLALVLPLGPLPVGTPFLRRTWPAHLTVLSNFRTDLDDHAVEEAVAPVLASREPVRARIGEEAWFGPEHDVRVQLAESPAAADLHAALLGTIRPVAEFENPRAQGPGFRPHVTVVPGVDLAEGARLLLSEIALAEMVGPQATVRWVRRLPLQQAGAEPAPC